MTQGANMTGRALPAPESTAAWQVALGENMRAARLAFDVSLARVARAMGVHESTVAKWERGENAVSAVDLWCFAAVLGADVADLLPSTRREA